MYKSASMINVPFHRIAILNTENICCQQSEHFQRSHHVSSKLSAREANKQDTQHPGWIIKLIARIKVFANFGHKTHCAAALANNQNVSISYFPASRSVCGRRRYKNSRRQKPLTSRDCQRVLARSTRAVDEVTKNALDVTGGEKGAR
jgi:RNase adaptor protein for sRNA GlmZ degradation